MFFPPSLELSVCVGEDYIHRLAQQPHFVTWTPSFAPGPCPHFPPDPWLSRLANQLPSARKASTRLASGPLRPQTSWKVLFFCSFQSFGLVRPFGAQQTLCNSLQSAAQRILEDGDSVSSCHTGCSRLNDPDLFNHSLGLLSPSALITLFASCCYRCSKSLFACPSPH